MVPVYENYIFCPTIHSIWTLWRDTNVILQIIMSFYFSVEAPYIYELPNSSFYLYIYSHQQVVYGICMGAVSFGALFASAAGAAAGAALAAAVLLQRLRSRMAAHPLPTQGA